MRSKLLVLGFAALIIDGISAGLSSPLAAAESQTFCMADNLNRIFKLNQISVLVVGQLWAVPFNPPVFGTLKQDKTTGQYAIKLSFTDPVSGPPSWKCQGVGLQIPSFNGQCQSGLLILPWATRSISCPF